MTSQSSRAQPVRRDLTDPRSSASAAAPTRKVLLNDRRSTRP